MAKRIDVPVYLFTGFLEAGKTKFVQETLEDKRFCNGERTLLLLCEEGIEEFEPDEFADPSVYIKVVEEEAELTTANLLSWLEETHTERVLVEYNGMWQLDTLYTALPENWMVYQEFMFVDSTTFINYNTNIRQLMYDKLKSAELVVFNRFKEGMDKMLFHKIVRGASRRADIAYEYADGKVEYDDIEDPLPYDINAPVIEVGDNDYAIWYRDMSEEPDNYENKIVRFKCQALAGEKIPYGNLIVGRDIMSCCADDVEFAGLLCRWENAKSIKETTWVVITAKINYKFTKVYGREGPVLTYIEHEVCPAPDEPVATFY
ncbi:MAG: GTPase [Oscillospiraceae bacterium]|nr:GTPase [Oscillospiraceae bacterium]